MIRSGLIFVIGSVALAAASGGARADTFKSAQECVAGRRVADNAGKTGKVIGMSATGTTCRVLMDNDGKEAYYIFWMLHAEGQSAETDDKLVAGTYECFANLRYAFMDVKITGADTYQSADASGRFHVEPSRKIVFESGPLKPYTAKLLAGPSIGLNTDGGSFYATTCELKKQ